MRNALLLVVVMALASTTVSKAWGEDKAAARAAFAEGQRRYDLNEFEAALENFKRAYLAFEDPAFLYNIAQCHRQLGNKNESVKFYRSYLRKVPDASNADEVKTIVATLETEIAAEKAAAAHPALSTPPPTAPPAVVAAPVTAPLVVEKPSTPAYKKWWVWTIVGVAAAGAATGLAIGLTSQRTESSFMPVTVSQ